MNPQLKRRIARVSLRILAWGRDRVPPGVRSLLGIALMVAGVFGFLPILGFWMFPLGIAFIALDLPITRRGLDRWMLDLARAAESPPPETSS